VQDRIVLISMMIMLLANLTLCSCDSSTSSSKGSIVGTILLDGETDHSGIVVSIYNARNVPTELSQVLEEYPQLSFQLDSKVIFDHREQDALHTALTNADGKFSFDDIPYSDYIITYRKEGWGYNNYFNIELNESELYLGDNNPLKLYHEVSLPGLIEGDFTLESDKCYVATNDVVIASGAQMIMQSNSRLLLNQYVKIITQGNLVGPESPLRAYITSSAGIHSGGFSNADLADGVHILSDNSSIENMSFSYLGTGLKVSGDSHDLHRLAFQNCVFGLVINAASDIELSHCLFSGNKDINAAACYAYDVQGLSARSNIFYSNYIAHKHEIVKDAVVENNAYINNDRAYLNLWESTADFRYNDLRSDGVAIENSGRSNLSITYNNIESKVGVKTYHTNNWYNSINNGWTKANNNNIIASQLAVESRARYYYYDAPAYPLDFKNNYWGTTSQTEIADLVLDYHELGSGPPEWVYSEVVYLPFRLHRVDNAGIQPE